VTQGMMWRRPMAIQTNVPRFLLLQIGDDMFSWLSAKKSEKFGSELATLLMELMPNDVTLNESKRLSKANYAKDKMQKRIMQFKQEEILNFYKIAKLLNTFKWALKDAGYDAALADDFAKWILISLQSRSN
jgi:hypothetical protein